MATSASIVTTPASTSTTPASTTTAFKYPYISTCVIRMPKNQKEQKYCECAKKSFESRKDPKLEKIKKKSRSEITFYLRESKSKILILILVFTIVIIMMLLTVINKY